MDPPINRHRFWLVMPFAVFFLLLLLLTVLKQPADKSQSLNDRYKNNMEKDFGKKQ